MKGTGRERRETELDAGSRAAGALATLGAFLISYLAVPAAMVTLLGVLLSIPGIPLGLWIHGHGFGMAESMGAGYGMGLILLIGAISLIMMIREGLMEKWREKGLEAARRHHEKKDRGRETEMMRQERRRMEQE